jgi:hypothetical protein
VCTLSTIAGIPVASEEGVPPIVEGALANQTILQNLGGVAVDGLGNIFFTESNFVFRLDATDNTVSRVAGTGDATFSGDGIATEVNLDRPTGLVFDSQGRLVIGDANQRLVRWLDFATGNITTIAGNPTAKATASQTNGDGGPTLQATFLGHKSHHH